MDVGSLVINGCDSFIDYFSFVFHPFFGFISFPFYLAVVVVVVVAAAAVVVLGVRVGERQSRNLS